MSSSALCTRMTSSSGPSSTRSSRLVGMCRRTAGQAHHRPGHGPDFARPRPDGGRRYVRRTLPAASAAGSAPRPTPLSHHPLSSTMGQEVISWNWLCVKHAGPLVMSSTSRHPPRADRAIRAYLSHEPHWHLPTRMGSRLRSRDPTKFVRWPRTVPKSPIWTVQMEKWRARRPGRSV
jgi:hypothetical protein